MFLKVDAQQHATHPKKSINLSKQSILSPFITCVHLCLINNIKFFEQHSTNSYSDVVLVEVYVSTLLDV